MTPLRADRLSPRTVVATRVATPTAVVTTVHVDFEDEATDDEELANFETLAHVTRDDIHEQRERCQICEGVIHAPRDAAHAVRPNEPHGFDGTRSR